MLIEKKYPSRYDYGVKIIKHKGASITTSINTDIEKLLERIPKDIDYQVGTCASFIVHRPDNISNILTPHHYGGIFSYLIILMTLL